MADLPESRVNESPAFIQVGINCFGPIFIKQKKFRNKIQIKAYGSAFVCMATKAIYIEIVSDLTTDEFLVALKRFISRRRLPHQVAQ